MNKSLTVGELRKALEGVPDEEWERWNRGHRYENTDKY